MSVLGTAKRFTNRALSRIGHRIDFDAIIPQTRHLVTRIARAGLTPATVFDIGVADGTPWIYEAWPNAKYFLFDPTRESLPRMHELAKTLNAEVFNIALGDETKPVRLNVRPDHSGSSLYAEIGRVVISAKHQVQMRRFDELVPAGFTRPALVKIDVQGAELLVLSGMKQRLPDIDFIIVETSLIATLRGGPEFAEVVALMRDNGFVLFEIVGILRRPLDQAVAQIDAVFVPKNSPLRQDRRWAGPEVGT